MPSLVEMAYALAGAWRLLRFDSSGLGFFDDSPAGFVKSFGAAVVLAPFYIMLQFLRAQVDPPGAPPFDVFVIETFAYAISWLAFPVVMDKICEQIGRENLYLRFIVAQNWAKIPQLLIFLLPLAAIRVVDLVPAGLVQLLGLLVFGYLVAYIWFIAKHALEIDGRVAAAIVLIDFVLSLIITIAVEAVVG